MYFPLFCHVKWNYGEITVTFFTKIVKFSEKTVSFVTYLVTFRWTIHQYVTNTVTSVTIISLYCHFTWQKKWKIHVLFTFISRQIHGTFTWRSRWHIRVTFTSISRQINVTAMVTHYGDIHVRFTANKRDGHGDTLWWHSRPFHGKLTWRPWWQYGEFQVNLNVSGLTRWSKCCEVVGSCDHDSIECACFTPKICLLFL